MRIGFDAKRAFLNNTGLGNYSRDTIRVLSNFYPDNKYFLYTPKEKGNSRLAFLDNRNNTFVRTPQSLLNKALKSYWRSKSIVSDLFNNKIDIYHGLSHELPLGIEKTNIKTVVTIHDLIFIRYPHLFRTIDRKIYYKKFNSACHRADKIIAVSQQTKQDIIDFFLIPEEKIEVIMILILTLLKVLMEGEMAPMVIQSSDALGRLNSHLTSPEYKIRELSAMNLGSISYN